MNIALIVSNQIFVMFLLIAIGYFMSKRKYFSEGTVRELNNFLLIFVVCSSIISAFQIEYNEKYVKNMLFALVFAIIVHVVGILIGVVVFKTKNTISKLSILSMTFSNSSFMAFPLLIAVYGKEGLFYGATYVAVFNIFLWITVTKFFDKSASSSKDIFRKIIKNPVIISAILGVILYVTNIRFPQNVTSVIDYLGSLNTPLAMILLGIFLSNCNLLSALKSKRIAIVIFLRLVLVPMIILTLAIFATSFIEIDRTLIIAILISAGCPTGATVAMMSERFGIDPSFGAETVSLCTIVSIATLPALMFIAEIFI